MDAGAHRDGHGEGCFHAFDGFYSHGVSHAHARAEVRVADAFGSKTLHQGADDGVTSRIPSGGDDGHGVVFFSHSVERAAQVYDLCVDVEAVHCVDSQSQAFFCVGFHAAGGSCQDGDIDIF